MSSEWITREWLGSPSVHFPDVSITWLKSWRMTRGLFHWIVTWRRLKSLKCIRTNCTLEVVNVYYPFNEKNPMTKVNEWNFQEKAFQLHSNSWNWGVNYRSIDNFSIFIFFFSFHSSQLKKLEFLLLNRARLIALRGSVSWMNAFLASLSCLIIFFRSLYLTSITGVINNKVRHWRPPTCRSSAVFRDNDWRKKKKFIH